MLQDDLGDDLPVASGAATLTFATPVASGGAYGVTIKTQPSAPTQTCMVVGGTGTVGSSDVSSVTVNCGTNSYVVGGTVTGLFGNGLILQNNGGHDVAISGSGTFAFTPPLLSGDLFAVTVKANPTNPSQTCTVTGGSGTITNANINAQVSCASTPFPVSVNVTGVAGSGLVLQDNAGDNLAVPVDGAYMFATPVRSGLTFAVTVLSQPINPWQTCTVAMPSGTMAAAGVTLAVSCVTNTYTIGGTVSGLNGAGLVLFDNGADNLSISANGAFTFATPVASGAPYVVTVATSPKKPDQTCTVTNGTGAPNVFNVTNVKVSCANTVNCAAVDENRDAHARVPRGRDHRRHRLRELRNAERRVRRLHDERVQRRHQRLRRDGRVREPTVLHRGRHQRRLRRSVRRYLLLALGSVQLSMSRAGQGAAPVTASRRVRRALPLLALAAWGCGTNSTPSSVDFDAIDHTVDPCQDFYRHACGQWLTTHPISSDGSYRRRFDDAFYAMVPKLQAGDPGGRRAARAPRDDPHAALIGNYYTSAWRRPGRSPRAETSSPRWEPSPASPRCKSSRR